jgi:hypothetical protein
MQQRFAVPDTIEMPLFQSEFLNDAQRHVLSGTLKYAIEEIMDVLNPILISAAFNAILTGSIPRDLKDALKEKEVWLSIVILRNILSHPCPQNRRIGDANALSRIFLQNSYTLNAAAIREAEEGVYNKRVYYYNEAGDVITEDIGVFGLTRLNNLQLSQPVTQEAVQAFILHSIDIAKRKYLDITNYNSDELESCINSNYKFSKTQWVVSVMLIKADSQIYGIYLEGIKENGRIFKDRYFAHTYINSREIRIVADDYVKLYDSRLVIDTFHINPVQGRVLTNSIKEDVTQLMPLHLCTYNASMRFFSQIDYTSKTWAKEKLALINLKFEEAPSTFSGLFCRVS